MNDRFQLKLLRLEADLYTRLRGVREAKKAIIYGLRVTQKAFGAPEAALATLSVDRTRAKQIFTIPKKGAWDDALLTPYLLEKAPPIPANVLLAPIQRRGRSWAVLALKDEDRPFTAADRKALLSITQTLTDIIEGVDRERTHQVQRKIERKIAKQLEPKDLMYQILHGLRSLTHYDHSASLLIANEEDEPLKLVAEQVAWTKGKSEMIGLCLDLDEALRHQLHEGEVRLYTREGTAWRHGQEEAVSSLPRLLDYNAASDQDIPPEVAMLCAPIATPEGTLGVLKIAATRQGILGDYEGQLVEEFMPLASLAIQFSVRTESLRRYVYDLEKTLEQLKEAQDRLIQAEKMASLGQLTAGIAHEIKNPLNFVNNFAQLCVELTRELHEELEARQDTPVREALQHIEDILIDLKGNAEKINEYGWRADSIVRAMMQHASGSTGKREPVDVNALLDENVDLAYHGMRAQRSGFEVAIEREYDASIGRMEVVPKEFAKMVLNLLSNAFDAVREQASRDDEQYVPTIKVSTQRLGNSVEIRVTDNGPGIPEAVKEKIFEPFFTTKPMGAGTGLGLSLSYDIVVQGHGGTLGVESTEPDGATFVVTLPVDTS